MSRLYSEILGIPGLLKAELDGGLLLEPMKYERNNGRLFLDSASATTFLFPEMPSCESEIVFCCKKDQQLNKVHHMQITAKMWH